VTGGAWEVVWAAWEAEWPRLLPLPLSSRCKAATDVPGARNDGGAVVVHGDSAMTQCM
jgi:hypothetical protein